MLKSNKILVLAEDYPDLSGSVSLMYIHTRNIQYVKRGFDVVVLNFSAETNYQIDGIRVITERTYDEEKMQFARHGGISVVGRGGGGRNERR